MGWYRNDKTAVVQALRRGERPDLATTMASGPLDELVALHEELGIFTILDGVEVQRARAGIADELLLRTLATLPFVEQASLSGGSSVLFREPAVLLQLGWAPMQIRAGSNGRHRHPQGRQAEALPCHPDTLRDALRRVGESAWLQAQAAGVASRYQRHLVRGKVYAVDGSGLGNDLRLVALVSLPEDRLLYQDLQGLAAGHRIDWTHHRYLRIIQGHKQVREVEVTAAGALTSWDGFTEKASSYGVPDASLWACLIHDVTTQETAAEAPRALVSTRPFTDGFAALQAYRPRWHSEDDTYRELKEGWGREQQRWGRDFAAVLGRTTLTCLAFNTAQVYRLHVGERLAVMGIRRLRRFHQRELGNAPAVLYVAGCYGVFALEELPGLLGSPARESLLPDLQRSSSPTAPT